MKLVLNSISHHDCPVEVREKVAFSAGQQRFMLEKMRAEESVSEAVILETCNRLEFYVYAGESFDCRRFLAELIGQLRPEAVDTWCKYRREAAGIDVARHLFEVSAGLDSQMIGENQILSQVKSAYAMSVDCGASKFMFHRLFHNAFRVGKAVRSETDINCGAVSVSLAAIELARREIDLSNCRAMILGAGENAELAARYLLKAGLANLIIANRNIQKAESVAARLKAGRIIGLADAAAKLVKVDLLIGSTAAVEPIVTYEAVADYLTRRERQLLIIDIAVPRDIDPRVGQFKCVTLYNIDDLNEQINRNKVKRRSEIPKAQQIVAEFTEKFSSWLHSLNLLPVISRLMQRGTDLAQSEARRYAKDFCDSDSDKLELFAESLVKKILYGPIKFLKGNGDEQLSTEQLEAIDLINKMFLSQGKHEG